MKSKVLAILSLALILAMVIPVAAFASNESTFNALTLSGVAKYDTKLPTGGTKKTAKQLRALLSKIKNKMPGKGTTMYACFLDFDRSASAGAGTYSSATKMAYWWKIQKKNAPFRSEYTNLMESPLRTRCQLLTQDSKYTYHYSWLKNEKTGDLYKSRKTSSGSSGSSGSGSGSGSGYKESNFRVYKDQKVLGEKCFVFSYNWKSKYGMGTNYHWVSRKTRVEIKNVSVSSGQVRTQIAFVYKKMNKAANFYKPPTDVTFTTYESISSQSESIAPRLYDGWLDLAS